MAYCVVFVYNNTHIISMKNILNLSQKLPFTYPYKSSLKSLLPVKSVIRNLGATFYPRLLQIHQNLTEALVLNDHKYLKQALIPELEEELLAIKSDYKQLGCRFKINQPRKKLLMLKNYLLPETVYRTENCYISLACRVYFGGQLVQNAPFGWQPHQRLFRFGKYRYILYDKSLSLRQNLSLIFSRQIYEFIIKYQSSKYINIHGLQTSADLYETSRQSKRYDEQIQQDIIQTEVIMRSSSDKFDWIITDINGLMKNKFKDRRT